MASPPPGVMWVFDHRIFGSDDLVGDFVADLQWESCRPREEVRAMLVGVQHLDAFAIRPAVIAAALDDVDGFPRAVADRVGNQPACLQGSTDRSPRSGDEDCEGRTPRFRAGRPCVLTNGLSFGIR